jgi:hypothetical protein
VLSALSDGLRKIAENSPESDANSHRDNLNEAAKIILFKHKVSTHLYLFENNELKKIRNPESYPSYGTSCLVRLLTTYRDSIDNIEKAILAIKDDKIIQFKELENDKSEKCICNLEKGSKIKIDGKDLDCIYWLENLRDYYVSLKGELVHEVQTSPPIIDAVDYYFSIIHSDK